MGGARSADGTGQGRSSHGSQQEVKQEHAVTFRKSLSSAFIMVLNTAYVDGITSSAEQQINLCIIIMRSF